MNDGMATDLLVAAQRRLAAQSGISMIVVHKGDPTSGSILLKINHLDGTAEILTQIRMNDELFWTPACGTTRVPDQEADAYCARQTDFDPDLWVIEIEDREGRHWFPGRIIET